MVQILPLCLLAAATLAAAQKPTVYLIRHGEKPADGNGLNAQGVERAQCLRSVFGKSSGYDIGHVMAQTPKSGMFLSLAVSLLSYFSLFLMWFFGCLIGSTRYPTSSIL